MLSNSDFKLASQPKVLLHRLEALLPNKNDKTNKTAGYEDSGKSATKDDKADGNIPSSIKKKEKMFEKTAIQGKECFQQLTSNIYSSFVKCEKMTTDQLKNTSHIVFPNKLYPSEPNITIGKETKLEQDSNEHSKSSVLNKPLLNLIPSVKSENSDIITVKRTQLQDVNLIDIEKEWQGKGVLDTAKITPKTELSTLSKDTDKNYVASIKREIDKSLYPDQKVYDIEKKCEEKTISSNVKIKSERELSTSSNLIRKKSLDETKMEIKKIKSEDHSLTGNNVTLVQGTNLVSIKNQRMRRNRMKEKNILFNERIKAEKELSTNITQNSAEGGQKDEASNNECSTGHSSKDTTCKSSDTIIKVKDPSALGVQNNTQGVNIDKSLIIYHQNQIKSSLGNESKIAEILRIYPLFFTSEVRHDIKCLTTIINESSKDILLDQDCELFDDEKFLSDVQNCSITFIETFKKILKLNHDDDGLDINVLKMVIPMLYLQMDKVFERLGKEEEFDFRTVMKKLFEIKKYVCVHDKMLQMAQNEFKKVMATLYRWLSEVFIDCESLDSVEYDLSTSSSVVEVEMEVENEFLAIPEQNVDNEHSPDSLTSSDCDLDVNYLHCPECHSRLPLCFLCHELLTCPCLLKVNLASGEGSAMNLCREHGSCGDSWPQWEQEWENQGEGELPLDSVCWNVSCNNAGEILCVCRIRAYCSNACQIEDWREDHFTDCRRETEPDCCYKGELHLPQDIDLT